MTVDRQACVLHQRLDNGKTDREVRHEVPVHHVDMQPIGDVRNGRGLVG
jgi:hypothetical protein